MKVVMKDELIAQIEADAPAETQTIQDLLRKAIIPQGVKVPEPESVFSLGGATIFTKKSISTLTGKAKAGKTTATTWIVSQMLKQGLKVLWMDTEQGEYYGSRTQFWVLTNAGMPFCDDFIFFDLKIHRPETRSEIVEAAIQEFKPDMVIIDGSRDLLYDINSTEQSLILSNDLMKWAAIYDCHILTILHLNKDGMNARGHIGTELINKSETVIKVDKNDDGLIVCSPEYCRDKDFIPFAFDRDDRDMPQIVENFMGDTTVSNSLGREPALMPNDPNLATAHL
jgi:predicted ATP-dependent serine protease